MDSVLRLLAKPGLHSIEALCAALALTPEQLSAHMDALRQRGYRIDEAGGQGYTLLPKADTLLPAYVWRGLETAVYGRGEILYAPAMDSTNTQLKHAAAERVLPEGSLAVCERQTAGRGRLQRVWDDPAAGESLTCSLLLRPQLPREQVHLVTLAAAVAAAEALASFGTDARIKWPNDVVIRGRKCVGILCETTMDPSGALCVVAGAGFNVNQRAFTGELADKATSLWLQTGVAGDRCQLLCRYLLHLESAVRLIEQRGFTALMPAYAARSVTLGVRVRVIGAAEAFVGMAQSIDADGALLVLDDRGVLHRVISGDVSVRGVMGYV